MIRFTNLVSDAFRDAYSDRLRRSISRQRTMRLAEELHMAKSIQERLLPKKIPTIPGFQVAGRVIPASEVGGDYWSVKYYEDDGRVTMKLADISGHGIAAATLVAAVKFISGGYYRGAASAHEVIERTNRVLVIETPVEILVTMVYAWLYPNTREIEVVNAGHTPAFICRENTCEDIPVTGPVLGVASTEYGEVKYQLGTGDVFFLGSDGITEAGIGEPFGERRLKEVVLENRDRTADEIADAVIEAVMTYAGQPHDDVSLVVLKAIDAPAD
jgi:sigma-B regulation protein RsbU (phosphoserine phosphatase)